MAQTLYLIGLYDNGEQFSPRMPSNTARTISVPQFGTITIYVDVYYPSGVPVDLTALSAVVLTFTMQSVIDPEKDTPDLQAFGTLAPNGPKNRSIFTLTPDMTQINLGRYLFDVWLEHSLGRFQIMRPGTVVLQPGLAR